jgi:hypothetical protein
MYYPGVYLLKSGAMAIALRIFSEFTCVVSVKYSEMSQA